MTTLEQVRLVNRHNFLDNTIWEKKIIDSFISHYFASASAQTLRLRSSILFPNFDTAHHDEKVSFLEAAESLERKEIVKLRWEKRRKGERLATLSCENFEALFEAAGKPYPKTEAEEIRTMLAEKADGLRKMQPDNTSLEKILPVLEFFSIHFGTNEIKQGLNQQTMEELICLLEFSCNESMLEKITTRALSILLYNDSKRLENLLALCAPLLSRAQKEVVIPNFNFPQRSYPDTMISGKIIFEIKNTNSPIVNAEGLILNLPLESVEAIASIKPLSENSNKTVLTIENKETFYALGSPYKKNTSEKLSFYDCFLYTGGYPNNAVAALIKILAVSGFSFYHAGDLDPDGVLILQHINDIVNSVCPEKSVAPIKMDISTFDKYRAWARPLDKSALRQTRKIRDDTKAIHGLADLVHRIEETCLGVEQEIIDYR